MNLTAIWANDGGDKITRDERRATNSPTAVVSSIWSRSKVTLFGAKNEVVAFNLVLEAAKNSANNVTVSFNTLTGPSGATISSAPTTASGVFDWTKRNIELFYVRYLPIHGLSQVSYDTYDERHIPKRFERPFTGAGFGTGLWTDRPDHDKYYPDIAVPLELVPTFNITAGQNQSIWTDIYIPKTTPSGFYAGVVTVKEGTNLSYTVPVELTVRTFSLPDVPTSKTMVYLGYPDIGLRYIGTQYPLAGTAGELKLQLIRNRHFQLAHRHKISLVDNDVSASVGAQDLPHQEWLPRLSGSLFTAANGYDGPSVGVGNGIYSIGQYGSWNWQNAGRAGMWQHTNAWEQWFATNAPGVEHFLYLIDESSNYPLVEQYASWMASNPDLGKNLKSFATMPADKAMTFVPDLNIAASTFAVADTLKYNTASSYFENVSANKEFFMYNGHRPASGSFATEDDGVALRELAWGQYHKGVNRWYFWESTYYNDFQSGRGQNDLFHDAQTFGRKNQTLDAVLGETGNAHANGDGVLFYPGTDKIFTTDSYGLDGPLASLRLKYWRRGIQDVDYLAMAQQRNPVAVLAILDAMIPKVLWEVGVSDLNDPTWVRGDIGWTTNADDWEAARAQLANIIETGQPLRTQGRPR